MSKNKKKKKNNKKPESKRSIKPEENLKVKENKTEETKQEEKNEIKEIKQEKKNEKSTLAQEMYAIAKAVLEKKEEKKKEKAKRFENVYCKKIKEKLKKAALHGEMYIVIRKDGMFKNANFDEIEKYFKNEGFKIRRYEAINFDELEISFEKF